MTLIHIRVKGYWVNCLVDNLVNEEMGLEQQGRIINYLSVDVEDYFHVSAFESVSPASSWCARELRVEKNTEKILSILSAQSVKATFFVLGWVAQQCPDLVKRIASEGHEIASHGYGHKRVYNQSQAEFRDDITRSKGLLEDLSGSAVIGYRAPSYSISPETFWAFDELYEAGYKYDSSIFPIAHDLYGVSDWPRFAMPVAKHADGSWQSCRNVVDGQPALMELPITTLNFGGRNLPIAGGGYFRLLPYRATCWGLHRINQVDMQPFLFYLHPWEIDPQQPRMIGAGLKSRLRHYLNLDKTETRFKELLCDFEFTTISAATTLA